MKKYKVISNTPVRLPITSTVLYSFLLYYTLFVGIFIAIYSIYWILILVVVFGCQEKVDIFSEKTANKDGKMVTFAEKLKEKIDK